MKFMLILCSCIFVQEFSRMDFTFLSFDTKKIYTFGLVTIQFEDDKVYCDSNNYH
jgi:hypothetical protein